MHILYFTPYFNQPRGNSTTSKRIVRFLQNSGLRTSVFPYSEKDPWFLPTTRSVDVTHILHATRFLEWAQKNNYSIRTPYIVTMGGTDINVDLQTPLSDGIYSLLENAAYITVFTPDAEMKVNHLNPNWGDKVVVIPQSAWVPWSVGKPTQYDYPSILLPAGLRPIKDVLHTLPALDELIHTYPRLKCKIIGAQLDDQVHQQVLEASRSRPWLTYNGVVPFEVMTHWYHQSNIVINSSISEGQSLAVMEALALGRPVIARGNDANKEVIKNHKTGWIYNTMDEFKEAVFSIMNEPILRDQVIENSIKWVQGHRSPEIEANHYIDLYKRAGI